jgi:acyl transferase domain-containing protein
LSPAYESALDTLPESYFWDVARQPVYFERTLRLLERSGPHLYVDCSPSGTLDSFLRQILPSGGSTSIATLSPFGQDVRRLNQALQRLGVADNPQAASAATSAPNSSGRPA